MEENGKINPEMDNSGVKNDCGCADGNCCPPKKKNPLKTIIFVVIVLAALGVVAAKVFYKPVQPAGKEAACKPGSACCDTTKAVTCDTSKGSSCCPKK